MSLPGRKVTNLFQSTSSIIESSDKFIVNNQVLSKDLVTRDLGSSVGSVSYDPIRFNAGSIYSKYPGYNPPSPYSNYLLNTYNTEYYCTNGNIVRSSDNQIIGGVAINDNLFDDIYILSAIEQVSGIDYTDYVKGQFNATTKCVIYMDNTVVVTAANLDGEIRSVNLGKTTYSWTYITGQFTSNLRKESLFNPECVVATLYHSASSSIIAVFNNGRTNRPTDKGSWEYRQRDFYHNPCYIYRVDNINNTLIRLDVFNDKHLSIVYEDTDIIKIAGFPACPDVKVISTTDFVNIDGYSNPEVAPASTLPYTIKIIEISKLTFTSQSSILTPPNMSHKSGGVFQSRAIKVNDQFITYFSTNTINKLICTKTTNTFDSSSEFVHRNYVGKCYITSSNTSNNSISGIVRKSFVYGSSHTFILQRGDKTLLITGSASHSSSNAKMYGLMHYDQYLGFYVYDVSNSQYEFKYFIKTSPELSSVYPTDDGFMCIDSDVLIRFIIEDSSYSKYEVYSGRITEGAITKDNLWIKYNDDLLRYSTNTDLDVESVLTTEILGTVTKTVKIKSSGLDFINSDVKVKLYNAKFDDNSTVKTLTTDVTGNLVLTVTPLQLGLVSAEFNRVTSESLVGQAKPADILQLPIFTSNELALIRDFATLNSGNSVTLPPGDYVIFATGAGGTQVKSYGSGGPFYNTLSSAGQFYADRLTITANTTLSFTSNTNSLSSSIANTPKSVSVLNIGSTRLELGNGNTTTTLSWSGSAGSTVYSGHGSESVRYAFGTISQPGLAAPSENYNNIINTAYLSSFNGPYYTNKTVDNSGAAQYAGKVWIFEARTDQPTELYATSTPTSESFSLLNSSIYRFLGASGTFSAAFILNKSNPAFNLGVYNISSERGYVAVSFVIDSVEQGSIFISDAIKINVDADLNAKVYVDNVLIPTTKKFTLGVLQSIFVGTYQSKLKIIINGTLDYNGDIPALTKFAQLTTSKISGPTSINGKITSIVAGFRLNSAPLEGGKPIKYLPIRNAQSGYTAYPGTALTDYWISLDNTTGYFTSVGYTGTGWGMYDAYTFFTSNPSTRNIIYYPTATRAKGFYWSETEDFNIQWYHSYNGFKLDENYGTIAAMGNNPVPPATNNQITGIGNLIGGDVSWMIYYTPGIINFKIFNVDGTTTHHQIPQHIVADGGPRTNISRVNNVLYVTRTETPPKILYTAPDYSCPKPFNNKNIHARLDYYRYIGWFTFMVGRASYVPAQGGA